MEWGSEDLSLNRCRVADWHDNVAKVAGGDGCVTVRTHLAPLNQVLKVTVKTVKKNAIPKQILSVGRKKSGLGTHRSLQEAGGHWGGGH